MLILSADTSTNAYTVGLFEVEPVSGGPIASKTLAERASDTPQKHAEDLLRSVEELFNETGLSGPKLDALAISIGPGSFTGLRIGASMWKGLALGWGKPLVAVPTLDAMTRLARWRDGYVCPLMDARMDEVYGALFRICDGHRIKSTDDLVCSVDRLLDIASATTEEHGESPTLHFVGEAASIYRERIEQRVAGAAFLSPIPTAAHASCIAEEAAELIGKRVSVDAASVVPVYLRQSQAERVAAQSPEGRSQGSTNSVKNS